MTDDTERMVALLGTRVLLKHGGTGDPMRDHWNLTEGDSLMHKEAAALLTKEREARETLESARQVQDAAIMNLRADFRECATRAESAEAEAKRLREALAKYGRHDGACEFHYFGPCNCGFAPLLESARTALAKREGGEG